MGPMLAFFSISPLGEGESVSGAVAKIIALIEQSGLEHTTNAMGTIIEGEPKDVFDLLYKCHASMQAEFPRVTSKILIDPVTAATVMPLLTLPGRSLAL